MKQIMENISLVTRHINAAKDLISISAATFSLHRHGS